MTRHRLVIDVRPRLLATSLARVFDATLYDVVIPEEGEKDALVGDIAIVSDSLPVSVQAHTVVSIPSEYEHHGATIVWRDGEPDAVTVRTMQDLTTLIAGLVPSA